MHNLGAMFGHIAKAIRTPVSPAAQGAVTKQVRSEHSGGPVASPIEGYTAHAQQEITEQVTQHPDGRVVAQRVQVQRVTMTPQPETRDEKGPRASA